MDKEFQDVKAFNLKFGLLVREQPVHLTKRKLKERSDFLQEELDEFVEAAAIQDLAGLADALVDLVYVAKGTAVMMGLPWEALWEEVQRANMAKVRGQTKRGHMVDCVKPVGWEPPGIMLALTIAGYEPMAWVDEGFIEVDEVKCHDD